MAYSMFVKLTPEQLEERRRQLNAAGFLAWLTPIVGLLVVYTCRVVLVPLIARASHTSSRSSVRDPSNADLFIRRARWFFSTTYLPEFGPLSYQLLALGYAAWLLHLATRNTGDDYMHVTKAFGHVAVSQLPFQYLLAMKPQRWSPISRATGLAHEKLNAVHRLFGRIVHVFLALHAVLYLRFFIALGILPKRIRDWDVRFGLMVFWSTNILAILALPPVRRQVYHAVFYRSHVVLSAVLVPALWFHVPYTRWIVAQVAVIYLSNGFLRMIGRRNGKELRLKVSEVGAADSLVKVRFSLEKDSELARAVAGQHVYLVRGGPLGTKTPLSIANVDQNDKDKSRVEITLVARKTCGPGTSHLARLPFSEPKDKIETTKMVHVEGPYGEAASYLPRYLDPSLSSTGPILLIAGGIGATYTLPIYLALLSSAASKTRSKTRFIWLVKKLGDARWGIEILLAAMREGDIDTIDVEVHVTQSADSGTSALLSDKAEKFEKAVSSEFLRAKGLHVHNGGRRPDLQDIVDGIFQRASDGPGGRTDGGASNEIDGVSVFLCGPGGLAKDVRGHVGRWVWSQGREVSWHEEVFGFGGS